MKALLVILGALGFLILMSLPVWALVSVLAIGGVLFLCWDRVEVRKSSREPMSHVERIEPTRGRQR